jgi:endonuclease/exonuclease/phosphatase family metal-dependent hydrolase
MRVILSMIVLFISYSTWADTVVPRDSVVNWANVRAEGVPGSDIEIVGHLHPGDSAEYLDDIAGYYKIKINSGVTGFASKSWTERIFHPSPNIKIATFNIQTFGKTKASKPNIMQELAAIVRKYDIVAIQEIKNKEGSVPTQFLTEINNNGSAYTLIISERTGLQPDDKSSQEQYAYYFNTETIHIIEDAGLYDDSESDNFQREPYVARFGVNNGNFTFTLITVHTKPEAAVSEVKSLHNVFLWSKTRFPNEDDFIALGDFNASCTYASSPDFIGSPILDDYVWIVPDDADTNFSTNSVCAYDRIVITNDTVEDFAGNWDVDTSVTDNSVSDHFPVWAEFRTTAGN